MDMNETAQKCFEISKEHGWWDEFGGRPLTPTEIAMKLALIHSEVSEALEEVRENDGSLYFTEPYNDFGAVLRRIVSPSVTGAKPEGFPSELADIIIRVFDLAVYMGIDIEEVVQMKMAYNKGRPHRHGDKAI